jgi:hypothetical protein
MRPIPEVTSYAENDSTLLQLNENRRDLLNAEHSKVVEEIKMRSDQEDQWFRYKFVLVGGLLAAFLTNLGLEKYKTRKSNANSENLRLESEINLVNILKSTASLTILAIALMVAIAIDIHIRVGVNVTNQLGIWICYFVEPTLLGQHIDLSGYKDSFLPWEQFLRIGGEGLHSNWWLGLIYWPHLHFFTFLMLVFYTFGCQQVCIESHTVNKWLVGSGFFLVYFSLFIFTIIAHNLDPIFEVQVFPWPGEEGKWLSGLKATSIYVGVWLILVLVNTPYLLLLQKKRSESITSNT